MIPPNKSRLFQPYFSWHVQRRFRRRFSAVRVHGLEHLAAAVQRAPVLLLANHTCWWDSLFCFDLLYRTLHADAYAMMDADNLRKLPFLGWIGGFGVQRGDKEDGERAITFAASLLDRPGRVVLMFPQGAERPITERPLLFRPGAARITLAAPQALVVPVGLRYELGKQELPFALVKIGEPVARDDDVDTMTAACARAVGELMDETQRAVHDGSAQTWPLYIGRDGDAATTRALAKIAGAR